MSGSTLDAFFGTKPPKPVERCFDCGTKLSDKDAKYWLRIKGKENPYCPACAKRRLKPQESGEEAI